MDLKEFCELSPLESPPLSIDSVVVLTLDSDFRVIAFLFFFYFYFFIFNAVGWEENMSGKLSTNDFLLIQIYSRLPFRKDAFHGNIKKQPQ